MSLPVGVVQMGKNSSVYPTSPVTVPLPAASTTGNGIIVVVEGSKVTDPYSIPGGTAGVTTLPATAPTVKDSNGNNYAAGLLNNQSNFDGDLGYYSSLYMFYMKNVTSITSITVTNADANGRPVFNHGMNVQVIEVHVDNALADDNASDTSSQNPAVSSQIAATQAGDLLIVAGVFRKNSQFTALTNWTMLDSGRIEGTANDYYGIAIARGNVYTATEDIADIAITSDELTVTTAAGPAFVVGAKVTFAGLTTNTFLNAQTVTITAVDTGTHTFTADFTHADVAGGGGDTGTVTGSPATSGVVYPGFSNPMQSNAALSALALKATVIV